MKKIKITAAAFLATCAFEYATANSNISNLSKAYANRSDVRDTIPGNSRTPTTTSPTPMPMQPTTSPTQPTTSPMPNPTTSPMPSPTSTPTTTPTTSPSPAPPIK